MIQESPSADTLLEAVARFLKDEAAPALKGRTAFLAKVAANAVEIARRDQRLRPGASAEAAAILQALLKTGGIENHGDDPVAAVCTALREGVLDEATPGLMAGLFTITRAQLAIDQPGYSGLSQTPENYGAADQP